VKKNVWQKAVYCIYVLFTAASALPALSLAGACEAGAECVATSEQGHFTVTFSPMPENIPLREYHDWVVEVRDPSGKPVELDNLSVSGGMPGHGHGLPSQPKAEEYLGQGKYRVSGFLFNMHGDWVLRVHLIKDNIQDIAETTFSLEY